MPWLQVRPSGIRELLIRAFSPLKFHLIHVPLRTAGPTTVNLTTEGAQMTLTAAGYTRGALKGPARADPGRPGELTHSLKAKEREAEHGFQVVLWRSDDANS